MTNVTRFFIAIFYVICTADRAIALNREVELITNPPTSACAAHAPGTLMVSGFVMADDNLHFYETAFDPLTWSGSLRKKKRLFDDDAGAISRFAAADWDAAEVLTGRVSGPDGSESRRIYTASIGTDHSFSTVPFVWLQLSVTQKLLLNISHQTGAADQLGEKRLDYLRGDRRDEAGQPGGVFRKRQRELGDILNSPPVFLGTPTVRVQASGYSKFYETVQNRRRAVFVGANDGMLHAFDADNGNELFAYIPNALFPVLGKLAQPGYVHRPFVDGAITVAEARIGMQWKTVLVAGMGGGAQGVFALDVTDAENFGKGAGALWEFTDADDAEIGNIVGAPAIARFKVGMTKGVAEYRYFAIVSSGLNNYVNDGEARFNANAPSALFLLALDKPTSQKWIAGVNYYKFSIPSSDRDLPNGLSEAAPVIGEDGAVTYVYAGDLQGNLWRFDFTGLAPWPKALPSTLPKPIFAAMDNGNLRQPITQRPHVVLAPGGYVVLFGTGKLLEANDLDSKKFATQSFYGILDTLGEQKTFGRSRLAPRVLIGNPGSSVLEISGSHFKYGMAGSRELGWYFDFIDSSRTGERSVSAAQITGDTLVFNTMIPERDPCNGSKKRTYMVNTLSGLTAYADTTGYLSATGMLNTIPMLIPIAPTEVGIRDATGKRKIRRKLGNLDPDLANVQNGGSLTEKNNIPEQVTTAGRLSWREIVNWVELRTSK